MEGGYELTVVMTGRHECGYLRDLYGCLLLNDYRDSEAECMTYRPDNGVKKRIIDKLVNIKDLPEGDNLLEDYPDELKNFVLVAVFLGYNKSGTERYV